MQGKNRINIANNTNPADITGGYLAEFSHEQNPKNLPTVNGTISKQQWLVKYPKAKNLTAPQLAYFDG
jgi:hypothetical protein